MPPMNRRSFVKSLGITPALATMAMNAQPSNSGDVFHHGVASGDPDQHSVVIWTRVTTGQPSLAVQWEFADDAAFAAIIATGSALASATSDHTVKILVEGLKPGASYWFRFRAGEALSPVGRTRTLPIGDLDRLGLAVASCSNYAFGYFTAYDAIAKDPAIDFVLHLGDYIYEYEADGWGGEVAKRLGREHEPANEIVTLADYRQRHAQYKTDPGSRAMHGAHPLLVIWDDHESANNPWTGGAQNHTPEHEGLWRDRRDASLRAYYEWMPIREPKEGAPREQFWRHYRFGSLATLTTLETRHTARARQVDYLDHFTQIDSDSAARAFEQEILGEPGRAMLSEPMETFLGESLNSSVRSGAIWRLVGNAIPMARMPVPDLIDTGFTPPDNRPADVPEQPDLFWKGRYQLPFYLDTWDGYPWARERFYAQCLQAGAGDLVVLTGDSHSFWANTLANAEGRPLGIEIGTAGISSPGDFVEQGFSAADAAALDALFAAEIAEVRWTDNLHQGYVRLRLTPSHGQADYVAVSTVLTQRYETDVVRSERFIKRDGTVVYA